MIEKEVDIEDTPNANEKGERERKNSETYTIAPSNCRLIAFCSLALSSFSH